MSVLYHTLFVVFLEHSFVSNSSIEAGLQCVLANANQDNVSPQELEKQRLRISNLFYTAKKRFYDLKQKRDKFEAKHEKWLNTEFTLPLAFYLPPPPSNPGRPKLDFSDKTIRGKKQEAKELKEENSTEKLLLATLSSLKGSEEAWHHDLHFLIKSCVDDHSMAGKFRMVSSIATSMEKAPSRQICLPKPLGEVESLTLLYETNLSERSYTTTRLTMKRKTADILPPYQSLKRARLDCRPKTSAIKSISHRCH